MSRNRRCASLIALILPLSLVAAACGGGETIIDDGTPAASDDTTGGGDADESALPDCLDFADLYALTGPESEGFSSWSDANEIAGELGSTTELPDVSLTVAGPGPESGTYDTYIEFISDDFSEERGVESGVRDDYQSSPNDNIIVQNLESADGSLGWVGYAFFVENQNKLDAFDVSHAADGVDCTSPTPETIASGEYPLSRPLFIYVNKAKAEANGTLSAWVDAYLGDLYDCVSEAGYVKLDDADLAETKAAWEATGLSGAEADGGSVTVSGSSTVEPISACVLTQAGFKGSVEGPGTGDGFKRFCAGETDISDASRPIKEEEASDCESAGIEYVELQVAIDGLAVMTAAG